MRKSYAYAYVTLKVQPLCQGTHFYLNMFFQCLLSLPLLQTKLSQFKVLVPELPNNRTENKSRGYGPTSNPSRDQ